MSRTVTRSVRGARGRTIVYDVTRPGSDSETEEVGVTFLVHGLGEHGGRYGHVARRLCDAGYVVVVPDHAGHGRSDGSLRQINRFADFVDDLGRVIESVETDGKPVFLIGHSMGGAIALSYALDHPAGLAGLVLSGPGVVVGDDVPPLLAKLAPLLSKVVPWMPGTELSADALSRDEAVGAAYAADPMVWHGKVPAGVGGALIGEMGTYPARLPSLTLPTLVLHGGDDRLTDPEGSRMVGRLAGGDDVTVKIYPGLFHEIFNEPEQDQVLDDVVAWLAAHNAQ
ncbi:MAG: alpha/beta hydrolase [Gordonia sp. (in: high G+C Gram-positive bacteria)]